MPEVVIAFVVGFVLGLLVAWFYWRQQMQERDQAIAGLETKVSEREGQDMQSRVKDAKAEELEISGKQKVQEIAVSTPAAQVEEEIIEPDDLKIVEGIGPKISSTLQATGIKTFAQLAATEVSRLQAILDEANLKLADPATWPEQAKLAAAGDWQALETLQDELKGGRRE